MRGRVNSRVGYSMKKNEMLRVRRVVPVLLREKFLDKTP